MSNSKSDYPNSSGPDSVDPEAVTERTRKKFTRTTLLILLAATLAAFIPMLRLFFAPIILASTFAVLFYPLYSFFLKALRGNRGLSSLVCCLFLVLVLLIPAYLIGYMVANQLYSLYGAIEPVVRRVASGEDTALLSKLYSLPLFSWLQESNIHWQTTALDALKSTGAALGTIANKTSMGALSLIVTLFITLFILFYLFMDGEKIVIKLRHLLPLRPEYQEMIIERFILVSRATVKGTLVIALTQATLGSLTLLFFGVKGWLLWGLVMAALGLIPMLGAWMVLIPTALVKLATGHPWQAVCIFLISVSVVSTIDNVMRPRLVGQNARMHDLLIFFSTIGGLTLFGPVGVIAGPVIAALFMAVIEIYGIEFKSQLDETR